MLFALHQPTLDVHAHSRKGRNASYREETSLLPTKNVDQCRLIYKLFYRRKEEKFTSIEQMAGKARIGKVAVETLQKAGCLNGMPRSEQLDMFDLL